MNTFQINESKIAKQTVKMLNDNDIHFHAKSKGDHSKFKCKHTGKVFIQDMGNKNQNSHNAKVSDVKRHRASINKPFISHNA